MFRLNPSEKFLEIQLNVPLKMRYAVSNHGRLVSYTETFQDGRIIKGGISDGYRTLHYRTVVDGQKKNKYVFLAKMVAVLFIPKTSEYQTNVLHLDYVRDNDKVANLKWATREEMLEHSRQSPHVKAARLKRHVGRGKLTSTQVIRLKKRLLDPNRKTRYKILAKEFGVSEMQLNRIRTGENWGHIKV